MALYEIMKSVVLIQGIKALSNDALQHTVLLGLYHKFYMKAFEKNKQYTVKVTPAEAIAFYLWFHDNEYKITSLEGITLLSLTNKIHKTFQTL